MASVIELAIDQMLSDLGDESDFAGSPAQIRQNQRAGRAAQERLGRALGQRGFRSRQEIRVGSGRLDVSAQRRPGQNFIYESKHIDLNRYLTPQRTLDQSRLQSVLRRHIAQVQRYQSDPAIVRLNRLRQQQNQPPVRVRLIYQVPAGTPRELAIAFQRLMLRVLAPHRIAGTVIMPGSRAASAFDS